MDGKTEYPVNIVINGEGSTATLILLHAFMQHNDALRAMAEKFAKEIPHLRVILPQSPQFETIKDMGEVPCWFLMDATPIDWSGVETSDQFIRKLIDAEVATGTSRSRIAVGGFSQGASQSAWTMCHLEEAVGGALLMSGGRYGMLTEKYAPTDEAGTKTSILIIQGEADPFCKPEFQHEIGEAFQEKGFADVTIKIIPSMMHSHFGLYEHLQSTAPEDAKEEEHLVGVDQATAEACAFLARVFPPLA